MEALRWVCAFMHCFERVDGWEDKRYMLDAKTEDLANKRWCWILPLCRVMIMALRELRHGRVNRMN